MEETPEELVEEFNIYRGEKYAEITLDAHTALLKAVHRLHRQSHFLIHRQSLPHTSSTSKRLSQLQTAIQNKLVSASKVLPVISEGTITVFIVEEVVGGREPVSRMGREGGREEKEEMFGELMEKVSELHKLGIAHLELSGDSVLVELPSSVYLRPFHLQPPSTADSPWYQSPEQIFTESRLCSVQSDIWSLGCLYSDFFLSLTPLFQSVETEDRFHRLFEIMGLPGYAEVKEYVSEEIYDNLRSIETEAGLAQLIANISEQERECILSMLRFKPETRPSIEDLICTWQPHSKPRITPITPVKTSTPSKTAHLTPSGTRKAGAMARELAVGPYEFYERSGRTLFSSIDTTPPAPVDRPLEGRRRTSDLPRREVGVPERRSSKAVGTEGQEIRVGVGETLIMDNQLTVHIHILKNLMLFKYQEVSNQTLSLALELDCGLLRPSREQTLPVLAAESITFDYTAHFRINSTHFKSIYRHKPIPISLISKNINPKAASRPQETLLGVCKVYIGLLFVSSKGESRPKVEGWFHVVAEGSGAILGQMRVEVGLEKAVGSEKTVEGRREVWSKEEGGEGKGSLATICQSKCYSDMDSLTAELRKKAQFLQNQPSPPPSDFVTSLRARLFPRS